MQAHIPKVEEKITDCNGLQIAIQNETTKMDCKCNQATNLFNLEPQNLKC